MHLTQAWLLCSDTLHTALQAQTGQKTAAFPTLLLSPLAAAHSAQAAVPLAIQKPACAGSLRYESHMLT